MRKLFLSSTAFLAMAGTSLAHDYKVGDLVIDHPVARATPANAPVSAGYMTIRNTGDTADRLIAGEVNFAGNTEIHEMTMDGDVMRMREIEGGIEIPAGGEVRLMPGGLHVMFMDINQQLTEGETHSATLTFENAGTVEVTLNVESLETIRKNAGMAEGMKMDHSGHGHGNGHGDGDGHDHSGHSH
ncbi:MAG: copper chaperone PCu(A)C [Pseudomonadota bacterium]